MEQLFVIDTLWYYVAAGQQKRGPVAASIIKGAYLRGELGVNDLVWHAQLPHWQTLGMHAAALGVNLNHETTLNLNGREVKYAQFFHRWAALMLDQWLLSITALMLVAGIAGAIYVSAGFSFEKEPEAATILLISSVFSYIFLYLALSGTYHIYYETSSRHGSLGKQYLGLEVRTEQGEALDRPKAALRWFSAALSHLSQNIGFLIAAFTQKRQALHDFLAHTLVIERDSSATPIDRNKRTVVILILGVFVMPLMIAAITLVPMFHFIRAQEQAESVKHQKMAELVIPIQQAVAKRAALDNNCLSQDAAEIKPLLRELTPMTSEIYIGPSSDERTCEIYLAWGTYKSLSYRYAEDGVWTCEATHTPQDFGDNCHLTDY